MLPVTTHRLLVLRHSKSAWPADVPDEQRPLNERGMRDAAEVGAALTRWLEPGANVLVSPALRTRMTWERAAVGIGDAHVSVSLEPAAYHAGAEQLLGLVRKTDPSVEQLLIVSHNPGVEALIEGLSGEWHECPTSALAVLESEAPWDEWEWGAAELVSFEVPRG